MTVLTWLDGETLDSVEITKELAFKIGKMTARLQEILMKEKDNFVIIHYDFSKS